MFFSFRLYMLSIMKDERGGPVAAVMKGLLRVLSWVYGAAVKLVALSYRAGMRKVHKASVPVVSVGNISMGGTGKTPFAIYLADHFLAAGRKPAVLTRGYGNDEDRMLRDELPDVPVFAGQDRVKNAAIAAAEGRDILILDDGFQHRRLGRDIDMVLVDSVNLFGNSCIFPRGVLREPVSSVKRADMVVFTKADSLDEARRREISRETGEMFPGKPFIFTRHRPSFLTDVTGAAYPAGSLKGKDVILASGIGDPAYFAFIVKELGANIVSRIDRPDHHRYTAADIGLIRSECFGKKAEKIVVTKKDYVKMKALDVSGIEEKLFVLNVVMDVIDGKERLIAGLDRIVNG